MYIHRSLEQQLIDYLEIFPVVGITGPRQSGKSTMLKTILPDFEYVSFDNVPTRQYYYSDPKGFLNQYSDKVIFDEVQKVPEIFENIKIMVDNERNKYGRYILTGSSQFTLVGKINESLAGRIGLLSLLPFDYQELPNQHKENSIWQGSYPELVTRNYKGFEAWFASYITTYIEKDVRDILNIGDLRDFQRLIELLAANCSQTLNFSEYSNNIGVSVPTIKRWISVLEASYIIFLLPPYYNNFGKRIIKSPKLYFIDTGLISAITGISTSKQFEKGPMSGALFENFIVTSLYKHKMHNSAKYSLYYLRTSHGDEIDIIVDHKSYLDVIEIKSSATANQKFVKNLDKYSSTKDNKKIIYRGKSEQIFGTEFCNYNDYLVSL